MIDSQTYTIRIGMFGRIRSKFFKYDKSCENTVNIVLSKLCSLIIPGLLLWILTVMLLKTVEINVNTSNY